MSYYRPWLCLGFKVLTHESVSITSSMFTRLSVSCLKYGVKISTLLIQSHLDFVCLFERAVINTNLAQSIRTFRTLQIRKRRESRTKFSNFITYKVSIMSMYSLSDLHIYKYCTVSQACCFRYLMILRYGKVKKKKH